MRKKLYIFLFLLFISAIGYSQSYTVSGYVTDSKTGETLIGVTVVLKSTQQGITTDGNGYFRMSSIKPGEYTLQFSYVGYKKVEKTVRVINKSILLNETALEQEVIELKDVIITAARPDTVGDKEIETSQIKLSSHTILNIPSANGDIFKAVKYLPGIEATDLNSPLYTARGGDPSGNLVLLDGVAIYNPYHFASSDGIFNIQSIKNIDLLVGGFGSEFGGRNSSILYITTKDGNRNSLHGEFEPTTTNSKVFAEFPVGKRGSMMVAGRYFYDIPSYFINSCKSYFYDFNISYTDRLNERNRITIKLFNSKDDMTFLPDRLLAYIDNSFNMDIYNDTHMKLNNSWSNKAATAILKTVISPSVFLKTQVYGSFHSADNFSSMDLTIKPDSTSQEVKLYYNTNFRSKINDLCAKSVLNIKSDSINTIKIGAEFNSYYFSNGAQINDIDKGDNTRSPLLFAGFIEDKIKLGNVIIRPGIRASLYSYNSNWQYEPRVNLGANLPFDIKFKAAWGIYYQNIISMNTQEYEINQFLDYYYPLKNHKPTKSIHYILGFEKPVFKNSSLSLDMYYIDMPVTYTFNLNQSELEARTFSDKLQQGTGKSYGIEVMFKANFEKFSGWISYSISKSSRSYPYIMNGKSFLFDFDRKHSFKAIVNYKIAPRLTYNFSLIALSGLPKTIETTLQSYYYYDPTTGSIGSYPFGISPTKNNARLPAVIELDMGIIKKIRNGFGAELVDFLRADESYFTLTISNLLFLRRNVIWYFPTGGNKYIPIGFNYFPTVTAGYIIKF